MRYEKCQINRRLRQRLFMAAGVLSLSLWLFMAVAEACPPLHAWLHGGTIPDDDDCAIVALAHGHFDSAMCDIPVVVPITRVETTPQIQLSVFSPAIENLPPGRAPPVPCSAS